MATAIALMVERMKKPSACIKIMFLLCKNDKTPGQVFNV